MLEQKNKDKSLVNEIIRPENAREHLANERTLLAWIRTSIGIMAFGFVVVKFSLFVKQISLLLGKNASIPSQHGYSSVVGILLVAVGSITIILSYIKFKQNEKELNNQTFKSSSKLFLFLIIIILVISILLILFLIENASRY